MKTRIKIVFYLRAVLLWTGGVFADQITLNNAFAR